MGVGVVEDPETGVRSVIIGTSEEGGYMRPGVRKLLSAEEYASRARGASHAERNILAAARERGLKLIAVGAGRNICEVCEEALGQDVIATPTRSGFIPFWMR
jgi:hypothetical protein